MDSQILHSGITVGTVLAYLGGGVGISIVAEIVKKVFGLSSSKVIHIVVVALSVAGTVLADAISTIHGNASLLAGHATSLMGLAETAHTFVVKDATGFIGKVQTALNDEAAKTPAVTSTAPATPPPVDTTPPAADF